MSTARETAAELRRVVNATGHALANATEADVSRSPAPGKWSVKEIIGHLIDSASNNHQRFVRAQQQDDMIFVGYDQDVWVATQGYATESWSDVLILWRRFNLHLAHVIERAPDAALTKKHTKHNLDQTAFSPVAAGDPVTLEWFMGDYVVHLKHHLKQIEAILGVALIK
jgi:DinB family protein